MFCLQLKNLTEGLVLPSLLKTVEKLHQQFGQVSRFSKIEAAMHAKAAVYGSNRY